MAYESKAIELIRNIQKELAVAQNELETLNDNFNRLKLYLVKEISRFSKTASRTSKMIVPNPIAARRSIFT